MIDKDFIVSTVKELVGHPEDVTCTRSVDERGVLLELKTNPKDMGVVIGKLGATARALRTLVRIVGMKSNARVNLRIFDPRAKVEEDDDLISEIGRY